MGDQVGGLKQASDDRKNLYPLRGPEMNWVWRVLIFVLVSFAAGAVIVAIFMILGIRHGGTAGAMLVLGYLIAYLTYRNAAALPVIRASIEMPPGVRYYDALGGHSAISPDGSAIAFVGVDSLAQQSLWVRPLQSAESRHLGGTTGATYPFWSPEGTSIGFFADGKLKTIDAKGGPAVSIAEAPFGRGGTWNRTGDILFAPSISDPNLYVVPAIGGNRRQVTAFDSTQRSYPRYPSFLPDGVHYVFTMLESDLMRTTLHPVCG